MADDGLAVDLRRVAQNRTRHTSAVYAASRLTNLAQMFYDRHLTGDDQAVLLRGTLEATIAELDAPRRFFIGAPQRLVLDNFPARDRRTERLGAATDARLR